MNEPVAEYESIIRRTENDFRVPATENERDEFVLNLIRTQKSTFSSIWPAEGKSKAYEIGSFLHSRHTLKLEVIGALLVLLLVAIVASSYLLLAAPEPPRVIGAGSSESSPLKLLALFIGPPVWIALFQILYTAGSKRRGAATMIIAEMTSIIRVYAAANIIGAFVEKYPHACQALNTDIGGFVDVARKENYLTIFDRNIEHLGAFPNPLIFHITSFFTFLKAARDATGALSLWSAPHYLVEKKKADIVDIVYLCFMQMDHGYLALCDLMEKRDHEALALIGNVTIGVSLQSYLFLLHVVKVEDFRYPALVSRLRTYRTHASNCGYSDLWNLVCPPQLLLDGPAIDAASRPGPK